MLEKEIDYFEELAKSNKEKIELFNNMWAFTMKDQHRFVNEYRKTFKEVCDHVEFFKQDMIKIIH